MTEYAFTVSKGGSNASPLRIVPLDGSVVVEEYMIATDEMQRVSCASSDQLESAIVDWAKRNAGYVSRQIFGSGASCAGKS